MPWIHSFHRITVTIPFLNCLCWMDRHVGCSEVCSTAPRRMSDSCSHRVFKDPSLPCQTCPAKAAPCCCTGASLHPWACKSSCCRTCAQELSNKWRSCSSVNEMAVISRKKRKAMEATKSEALSACPKYKIQQESMCVNKNQLSLNTSSF